MTAVLSDLKNLLPREHGSWAYALSPLTAAVVASPRPAPALAWLAGCCLLFSAFQGFAAARRARRLVSLAGVTAATAGLAVLAWAARSNAGVLLTLLPGAIPAVVGILTRRGQLKRATFLEVTGIAALAVQGTGGLLLGGGQPAAAALLAIASFCYFVLGLLWIRLRLAREIPGRTPVLPQGLNIPASLFLLLGSAAAGIALRGFEAGLLPGIYVARGWLKAPRRADGKLNIRALGIQEAILAAFFTAGLGLLLPA